LFTDKLSKMFKHRQIGVAEVIYDDDVVSFLGENHGCMWSDVA
jgi:hypothetical protein